MKLLLIPILFSQTAFADSYSDGLSRLDSIQKETKSLLSRAGIVFGSGTKSGGHEPKENRFFRVHSLPSTTFIPEGGLAFGKNQLRLLVGSEKSPVSLTFSLENKYPMLFGAKALGFASQNRGRVFAEVDRLVLRSGRVVPVSAVMLDSAGSLGVRGQNENSKTLEIAGGVGLGLLASPEEKSSAFGFMDEARKSATERIKSSLVKESRDYLREQFKESAVIRLDENSDVTILFNEEVRF
jgi:hypothetical protein